VCAEDICKNTNQFDFYPHPKMVQKAWTHNFPNLIEVSGLKTEFDAERQQDSDLDVNWKRRMAATWPA